ncbi:hypothetical protein [Clostridium algidicarnis]|uniref:hypothetical protein n=1 Tax=Clostridium algidicarnis TaxID=37659 RepID=UPI003FD86ED2
MLIKEIFKKTLNNGVRFDTSINYNVLENEVSNIDISKLERIKSIHVCEEDIKVSITDLVYKGPDGSFLMQK